MAFLVLRVYDRARRSWWGKIMADHDTTWTELQGATLALLVGLWLLFPPKTFSIPAWEYMTILPEDFWGVLCVLLGTTHLLAIRNGSLWWRSVQSICSFLLWFTMAGSLFLSNPTALGGVILSVFGAWQMASALRLRMVVHAP